MNKIHRNKIKKLLATFDIESLAISTQFKIRNSGKISPQDFLISFFSLMVGKCYSLRQWSITLSGIINDTVTFQAVAKRLNQRSLNFVKSLIGKALIRNVSLKSCINKVGGLTYFNRVLIEDSTCIKLPPDLFSQFPGSSNQIGKSSSVARIQLCVDIKNGDYINYDVASYRNNDFSYAANIVKYLKPNDLVIRDLGYSVNDVFNQISKADAFYIARLHMQSVIYSADNQELVDLVKILKKTESKGLSYFESNYIIGVTDKVECRIICTKLSQAQIDKRYEQRQKTRAKNRKPNKKTKYLLTWNILITNIKKEEFSGQQIHQMYTLRWHIELIFKTWKSYFKLDSIFKSCQGPNRVKPEILLYLCLCFIVVLVNPQFKKYQKLIYKKFGSFLSPMKFTKAVLNNLPSLMNKTTSLLLLQFYKNCCYDKRKDRLNIYERIIYV